MHLLHYNEPQIQVYIIRILMMIPVSKAKLFEFVNSNFLLKIVSMND